MRASDVLWTVLDLYTCTLVIITYHLVIIFNTVQYSVCYHLSNYQTTRPPMRRRTTTSTRTANGTMPSTRSTWRSTGAGRGRNICARPLRFSLSHIKKPQHTTASALTSDSYSCMMCARCLTTLQRIAAEAVESADPRRDELARETLGSRVRNSSQRDDMRRVDPRRDIVLLGGDRAVGDHLALVILDALEEGVFVVEVHVGTLIE